MTGSDKSKNTSTSAENLTKTSSKAAVELSETALDGASGGAVFPSGPQASSLKLDSNLKLNVHPGDPTMVLPAVQKP